MRIPPSPYGGPRKEFEPNSTNNNEGGLLAKLWRTLILDTGKAGLIPTLVSRSYERDKNKPNIAKIRAKSTLMKSAKAPEITMKTFVALLRDVICARRIRLTLEVEWPDGRTVTTHSVDCDLGNLNIEDDFLQEETPDGSNEDKVKTDR